MVNIIDEKRTPTVIERLATARNSSNLKLREEGRGDVDYIAGAGMAARNPEAPPGASDVLGLHLALNRAAWKGTLRAAMQITITLCAQMGWNLSPQAVRSIAAAAAKMHACPVCPACQGRKFLTQPGTPHLSDRPCPKCHGTGRRPLPRPHGKKVGAVIAYLERSEATFAACLSRAMK